MNKHKKKLCILVADDHELVRRGIAGLLRAQHGWEVAGEAATGQDAIQKAAKLKPDVLILDIEMPDVDGLEAAPKILEVSPETRILILTMHDSDEMVRQTLQAGALGYVLKSDLAQHLTKAVKRVSGGKLFLSPKVSDIVLKRFLKPEEVKQAGYSQTQLTPREVEIIRLVAQGKATKAISSMLSITERTVETHRAKIMLKLGLHSLAELIHYAVRKEINSKTTVDAPQN